MRLLPFIATCVLACPAAHADAVSEIFQRQRPGLWESKPASPGAAPLRICATEKTKAGGLQLTLDSLQQLGCRRVRDEVDGDRFRIELKCASANPDLGNFEMSMEGVVRADYMRSRGDIRGGGPLIQAMARSPELRANEWRWVRPCTASDSPAPRTAR